MMWIVINAKTGQAIGKYFQESLANYVASNRSAMTGTSHVVTFTVGKGM